MLFLIIFHVKVKIRTKISLYQMKIEYFINSYISRNQKQMQFLVKMN